MTAHMAATFTAFLSAVTPVLAASGAAADPSGDVLAEHQWTSRVIVVIAAQASDADAVKQRRRFELAGPDNHLRDLVLVEGYGDTPRASALRARFNVPRPEFRAILVGKDGGAKLVASAPIATERLFAEIDAMPMRRQEMMRQETRPARIAR